MMRWRRCAFLGALSMLCCTALAPSLPAQEACSDARRIVGGEDTNIKQHPWQVALDVDGELCGGAIIEQGWVLTAAHCFASTRPNGVRVKAGATNHRIGGAWLTIDRVFRHEKYDEDSKANDVALVRLKSRPAGTAIALAGPDLKLSHCAPLEVTGWGRTKEGKGGASDTLQKAVVPYVDNTACNASQSYAGKVLSGMMCAGSGAVDACQGDSGGPLVLRGPDGPVLVGIVSWGEGCGRQFKYGVYTRVSAYRDWILKTMAANPR